MTFEELTQRLHAVMDSYKISHRNDLAFLSSIAWIFDITIDFKLVPRDADLIDEVELNRERDFDD